MNRKLLLSCHKLFYNIEVIWRKMTHFQFRKQHVHDQFLAAEDRAVKINWLQWNRPSQALFQLTCVAITTQNTKEWVCSVVRPWCCVCIFVYWKLKGKADPKVVKIREKSWLNSCLCAGMAGTKNSTVLFVRGKRNVLKMHLHFKVNT